MKLTAKRVLKFLKTPGRYGDGNGLYLQVNVPGRASWILRYERAGRERAMGLGALVDFNLAEARQRAKAARLPMALIRSSTKKPSAKKNASKPPVPLPSKSAPTCTSRRMPMSGAALGTSSSLSHLCAVIATTSE